VTRPAGAAAWPMFRALVGIGVLCGLLIVSVYEVTAPMIAANKARALQSAIFDVLPAARATRAYAWQGDGLVELDAAAAEAASADDVVYAGLDEGGQLVGFAISGAGMGYQDIIRVLYGYAPDRDAIVGIRVLETRETPGLGDKIEKDPAFLANFAALDVRLTTEGTGLANPIVPTKHGDKTSPWQVDAITGATISSFAIANILNDSAGLWIPRLAPAARNVVANTEGAL